MSLSLLDGFTLWLDPAIVVLEHRSWRGQPVRHQLAVEAAAEDEADWQPALRAAISLIGQHARPWASLSVVVADQFVRYALLPWSDAVLGNAARRQMAMALLRHSFGESAGQLEIALDRPVWGGNGLVAGIHAELLTGLRRQAGVSRLRLNSIRPRMLAELDGQQPGLAEGYVVLPGQGWLTIIGFAGGHPTAVRNHRDSSTLPQMLAQIPAWLSAELAAVDHKILRILTTAALPASIGDWAVQRLPVSGPGGRHA